MDLRQFRYFISLCAHRNFTHAARACNVSQPSLTQAIRKLEEELGGALFTRDRSGCQPTQLGQIVRPRFEAAVAAAADAESEAARYVRLRQVPIRIGLMETVGTERLAPAFAMQQQSFPNIEIELITAPRADCLERLQEGWFDMVVGGAADLQLELYQGDRLYTEPYVVIFPEGHRFGEAQGVDIHEIAEETLLDRPNCEMRDHLVRFCTEKGLELYAPYRTTDVETMKRLVAANMGIAVLPRYSVSEGEIGIGWAPLLNPVLNREIRAIRARSQPMRRQTADYIRQLKARCREKQLHEASW